MNKDGDNLVKNILGFGPMDHWPVVSASSMPPWAQILKSFDKLRSIKELPEMEGNALRRGIFGQILVSICQHCSSILGYNRRYWLCVHYLPVRADIFIFFLLGFWLFWGALTIAHRWIIFEVGGEFCVYFWHVFGCFSRAVYMGHYRDAF